MDVELVIFDLDGVLVQSQGAESRALWEEAAKLGAKFTLDEAELEFRGKSMTACVDFVEKRSGTAISAEFVPSVRRRCEQLLKGNVAPTEGVADALTRLTAPTCVASSSPKEIIESRLRTTGLWRWFAGRIFSAYEVETWKPDPGLFLFAAGQMDVRPARCLVVEDSLVGVQAGLSAGMLTLGFSGEPYAKVLANTGVATFFDMYELPGLIHSVSRPVHPVGGGQ